MSSSPRLPIPTQEEYQNAARGRWAWIPGVISYVPGYRLFRRVFTVSRPGKATFYVSGDCRYRLYLDGELLASGPVKSPPYYKQLFRGEMTLAPGRHVLSAEVVVWADGWFGSISPFSEMHLGGGFYFSCQTGEGDLSTPGEWRGRTDDSRRTLHPQEEVSPGDFFFATAREETDFARSPGNWQDPDYAEGPEWRPLYALDRGPNIHGFRLRADPGTTWAMEMPQLRPMSREPMSLEVREPGGISWKTNSDGTLTASLPAGHATSLLTFPRYFTGHLRLAGHGARGILRLRQSEAPEEAHWQDDVLRVTEAPWRMETFEIRAAACLRIVADLETPGEVTLGALFCSYDFGPFRQYASSQKWLEKIYQVGVHTARCCAHDTYEDCPFYERFQYEGDTRIQALISYEATGNGELGRKAILDFQRSQAPHGLVQSRFPSALPQFIPGYALIWVLMIQDYLQYFPDPQFRHQLLWNVQGVLKYYKDKVSPETGLAGHPGHWGFTDWVEEWSFGDPSRDEASPTSLENLFYVLALGAAETMAREDGETALAQQWHQDREDLLTALKTHCWDPQRGLFRDVPGKPWFSRHAQALAVLADAVPPEGKEGVHQALLQDREGLSVCSLYFQFYVLDALRKLGDKEGMKMAMAPWRECLERFPWLTTFPEIPDATKARSMCHAWSAAPVYFLLKCSL